MFSAKKISKDNGLEPTEFEESVAQALFDLENTNQDLKSDLKDLYINSAAQIDVSGSRKAVVIHVPYRLRKAFRKIHLKLVRELEKKFSGRDVVVIATRRIVRPPKKGSAAQRPHSGTLTSVHDAILEDVVHPAEIVGKRIRYRLDGTKIIKDVVVIATRRIVRPPKKGSAAQRPHSGTLTSVHDAILEDVVHPAEIVGKRIRYRLDGTKIIKIYLDPKARNDTVQTRDSCWSLQEAIWERCRV